MKKRASRIVALLLAIALICGLLPVTAFADNTPMMIVVDSVNAQPGGEVQVAVKVEDNPGIASMKLNIAFDSLLTLTAVEYNRATWGGMFQDPQNFKNPVTLNWFDGTKDFTDSDAVFATLTFKVAEDAKEDTKADITVTFDPEDIYNITENNVDSVVVNGSVTVHSLVPGDINGDRLRNNKDVTRMFQYLANWEVKVVEKALDTNNDKSVNNKDLTRLFQFLANWAVELWCDGVMLKQEEACQHDLEKVSYKAPTCEEAGNLEYYYCALCKKNFTNASAVQELANVVLPATGHDVVIDEAVAATPNKEGLTEGSHCSACGKVFVAQEIIPPTKVETYTIEYDITNGDPYLEKLFRNGDLVNPNPSYYEEGIGLTLSNPSVAGYRFNGWYDLAENGTLIKKIDTSAAENYQLYAYWSKITYTVQYKSSLFVDRAQDTYTVDTGLVLPTPKLSNYAFVGWSDENGKLLTETTIPVGTTGNLILDGNWTSERNKTWTKPVLDKPIIEIDEENGVILFAYEIGEIQNVPLYTIKDFGYISGDGVTKSAKETYSVSITDTMMKTYAKSAAKATTESSNWTLANTWNATTSVNEEWCQENGKSVEETDTIAKSDSQNWNISNSNSGSTESTSMSTNQSGWKNEAKVNATSSKSNSSSSTTKTTENEAWNIDAKLSYTPKSYSFGIDVFEVGGVNAGTSGGWGGEIGGGYEHQWGEEKTSTTEQSSSSSSGLELGGSFDKSELKTEGTTSTASWNNTASYGGSSTNSATKSNSTALSEKISKAYGYGSSYATGGEAGSSQGLSASQTDSESYSSSVTYSTATSKEIVSEWTTQATKPGYHRWIVAGTAHVFAVVGYDISEKSYFTYTYSVMDDKTHEFEDYSYTSGDYNDQENGVISFEIPYEVAEYVGELTTYSDGLKVNQKTGIIEEYNGTDTCVVIPEYWNVGNGDVVKVTGFLESAFQGNKEIEAVVLSDFITEIPSRAFQGCAALKEIVGGNVSSIGSYAFDGCTSAEDLGVRSSIGYLGEKAFGGVQRLIVNAANKDVLKAAVESGAEQIMVSLEYLENGESELRGMELTVPKGTKFFELNGNYKTYEDFSLTSNAEITILNKINFIGNSKIPVTIDSSEVVFNQASVSATGIGLVLSSDASHVGLQGEITVTSASENAVLAKGLSLYEINKNVTGKLIVDGKMLQCGATENDAYLSYKDYASIDATMFENLLTSFTLYFEVNGGLCNEEYRTVANSTKIGTLPIPTRDHYSFEGWFLADETKVTEDSVFSTGTDVTVYAKWIPVPYNLSWNTGTGYTIAVNRTESPNANASIGELSSGDTIYFGDKLSVTYTKEDYYSVVTQGETEITVAGDVTPSQIFATAEMNPLSDWVKPSEVPSNATAEEHKWTYTKTTNKESRETSLAGYKQTGSYWVQSGSGSAHYASFPSGYDTGDQYYVYFMKSPYGESETATAKRTVSNSWAGYIYWHWMYGTNFSTGFQERSIYHHMGEAPQSSVSSNAARKDYYYFQAFTSSAAYPPEYQNWDQGHGQYLWYKCVGVNARSSYFYRFDYYLSTYTDYYKMFQYQKVENLESETEISASDTISNVQEWVRYREK